MLGPCLDLVRPVPTEVFALDLLWEAVLRIACLPCLAGEELGIFWLSGRYLLSR